MDQATARRFLFKVRFLPMTGEQIAAAFRRAFRTACPEFVFKLDSLTLRNFTVVARKPRCSASAILFVPRNGLRRRL
jgi:hypothetical protein